MPKHFVLYFLIIGSFLIFKGLGNDLLFAKFHQSDYKVKDYRMELKSFNKEVYHFYEIKTFKFNRSTAASNLTFCSKLDFDGKKMEIIVQVYKFTSNEYRTFPIRMQLNTWKTFRSNTAGLGRVFNCGNISIEPYYFKKGVVYHSCNFITNASYLPPYMPIGRYMIEATSFIGTVQHAVSLMFGEVYRDIIYRN